MGKINVGAWSGPSGKIGNLVAASWRGITYHRAMRENFTDANTLLHQATKIKMKLIVRFLKSCKPEVQLGFLGYSTPIRGAFHAAASYNYHQAIKGEFPALELDYSNVKVSQGSLPIADKASCEALLPGKISFTLHTPFYILGMGFISSPNSMKIYTIISICNWHIIYIRQQLKSLVQLLEKTTPQANNFKL